MQIEKQDFVELANIIAKTVADTLEKRLNLQSASANGNPKMEKTAYQKTEQLLYNYVGLKRIVKERNQEIEEIKKHGVPQTCGANNERVQNGNLPHGIVLPEESIESRIAAIQASVKGVVDVLNMIDKAMSTIQSDPYYKVLEYRYFDGRTQEDIAFEFGCSQVTISNNKSRLVRELALRLFPNDVVKEYMS